MLLPLLLTAILFLGPLALSLPGHDQRYCDPLWQDSTAWRDLVVAPVTEEFVFRALLLAVLLGKVSNSDTFILPQYVCRMHETVQEADYSSHAVDAGALL